MKEEATHSPVPFVDPQSIVRKAWGDVDTVLLIFAGAAAEFALNKSVDWLYFTGRLPADPIGRLFSTVQYARAIVFSAAGEAHGAIDRITAIHQGVEAARGERIPATAYEDVLYMLIDYTIRAHELLEKEMTQTEKAAVYDVFYRLGSRMGIPGLPGTYPDWTMAREAQLHDRLVQGSLTKDLFRQYRKQLGNWRFGMLLGMQCLLLPMQVRRMLGLRNRPLLKPAFYVYRQVRGQGWAKYIRMLLFPAAYRHQLSDLMSGHYFSS